MRMDENSIGLVISTNRINYSREMLMELEEGNDIELRLRECNLNHKNVS